MGSVQLTELDKTSIWCAYAMDKFVQWGMVEPGGWEITTGGIAIYDQLTVDWQPTEGYIAMVVDESVEPGHKGDVFEWLIQFRDLGEDQMKEAVGK